MSTANIEKFYEAATSDASLARSLIASARSPEEVIQRAIAAAKDQGLEVTYDEAEAWINAQRVSKANGELTDFQLERVAGGGAKDGGGYGEIDPITDGFEADVVEVGEAIGDAGEDTGEAIDDTSKDVEKWVKSW